MVQHFRVPSAHRRGFSAMSKTLLRVASDMGPRGLAPVLVAGLVSVAGCASSTGVTATGFSPAMHCGGRFCTVVTAKVDNGACTVSMKGYQDKYVAAGMPALWVVDDSHDPLIFADNGIVIDRPGDDFGNGAIEVTKKVFAWKALGPRDGKQPNGFRHSYSINLIWLKPGTQGVACTSVDPIIVNTG